MTIQEYVDMNLPRSIRYNPKDNGLRYGLPYPYIVPSVADMFQEMYYWDTYFANTGLIIRGDIEQAKNNVDNLLYLLERFGYVPNGNHQHLTYNSQPPFLAFMVREVYDVVRNKEWLEYAYQLLKKEHIFWTRKRITEFGLCRYDCEELPGDWIESDCAAIVARLKFRPAGKTDEELARGYRSSGESGWDLCLRMNWETYNYLPIDLNCLLYGQEDELAYFAGELNLEAEREIWLEKRDKRAKLIRQYLKDENGIFCDYYMPEKKCNGMISVASFCPLYFKMATKEEAEEMRKLLPRIEMEFGVVASEKSKLPGIYQWGYPNGWPPLQRIMVQGLMNYGYDEDAKRIASKYVALVEKCFQKTGHLWEKYNVVDGNVEVTNEYKMPAMLGWTFGTYYLFCQLLGK